MKCRKEQFLIFLTFSTNSDICRTVGLSFYIAKASGEKSGGFGVTIRITRLGDQYIRHVALLQDALILSPLQIVFLLQFVE